jgi:hypothetical protein
MKTLTTKASMWYYSASSLVRSQTFMSKSHSFWETTLDVLTDIYAVSKNIKTLPLVMAIEESEKYVPPTVEKYETIYDMFNIAREVVISCHPELEAQTETFESPNFHNEDKEQWFFINGILTSEIAAKLNAKALACIFDKDIHLIYNPTQTLFNDVMRCISSRTFGFPLRLAEIAYAQLIQALKTKDKVVLIAYSQGGIIASQIVSRLMQDEKHYHLACKLELYTFGNASNKLILKNNISENAIDSDFMPFIEHFANTRDFVAQISVIHYSDRIEGKLYTCDSIGHFLNIHYLPNLVDGRYGDSNKLCSYIKNKLPE